MNSTTKCPDVAELDDLLDERLSNERQQDLQEHLEVCAQCQERVANLDLDAALVSHLQAPREIIDTELHAVIAEIKSNSSIGEMSDVALREISLDFLDSSDDPEFLGRLGRYEISELVGRGGMGVVLKGYDPQLKRVVAIKVLAPELASNASARKRFRREGQAAAAVSHDHVVTIHGVDEANELPHLVMEYISGRSLQDRISEDGPLELKEILRIGMQAADGLAAAHAQGLVHRDIKPANILLENGVERVKITDFGLAHAVDDVHITRPGVVTGTPEYMSPEQARSEPFDHRSDLFSLGCVLYAMCTGSPPFRADSTVAIIRRISDERPRPIRELNPDIPESLSNLVGKLLAKDPNDRFQSAALVADLLGKFLAHLQQPGTNSLPQELRKLSGDWAHTRWRRRRTWLAAAAAILVAFVSLGLTEASGVSNFTGTVIRLVYGEGTLVIEVDDPEIELDINGEEIVISGAGVQKIRLRPGQYDLSARKDGSTVLKELVTIARGGRESVRVTMTPSRLSTADAERTPTYSQVWGDALDVLGAPSPDGRYLSFVDWETGDLAVRDLKNDTNRRLTNKGSWDDSSAFAEYSVFAPDGKHVAYAWFTDEERYDLRTIPANGGEPLIIYAGQDIRYVWPMEWSPDGKHVLAVVTNQDETNDIVMVAAETKEVTIVKSDCSFPRRASFSQDGKFIVYADQSQDDSPQTDIFLLDLDKKHETNLIDHPADDSVLGWSPDGKGILFASDRTGSLDAWLLQMNNGKPIGTQTLVKQNIPRYHAMGFTSDGSYFFAEDKSMRDVYVATLDSSTSEVTDARIISPHPMGTNEVPEWSPDGQQLAYISGRRKSVTVYSLKTGQANVLSTHFDYIHPWHVRWSPDQRSVLLTARGGPNGGTGVFRIDVSTGDAELLIRGGGADWTPAADWSPDGKSVYWLRADEGIIYQRVLATGRDEQILRLRHTAQVRFDISPDGQRIAFFDYEKKSWVLKVMQFADGSTVELDRFPGNLIRSLQWLSDGKTIMYGGRLDKNSRFFRIPVDRQHERQMLQLPMKDVRRVTVHPDGQTIAFSAREKRKVEIWAMKNFLPKK